LELRLERERRMMRRWRDVALMTMRMLVLNLQQLMRTVGAKRPMRAVRLDASI